MPKTFWQSLFFTTIMATFMVLIMSSYNILLHSNGKLWFAGWTNLLTELFCALPLALLFAGKFSTELAHKLLGNRASYVAMRIIITFFIAIIMVLSMSLFVLVRKFGISNISLQMYCKAVLYNIILAFPVQVLFLANLVRKIYRQLIGFKYQQRKFFIPLNPYLKNHHTILTTKIFLITNAVVIYIISL